LPYCIGGTLIPFTILLRLFGSQYLDKTIGKRIEAIAGTDMPMQGSGIELGQHEYPIDSRMNTVANRDIYQAILATNRNGWLGPKLR